MAIDISESVGCMGNQLYLVVGSLNAGGGPSTFGCGNDGREVPFNLQAQFTGG